MGSEKIKVLTSSSTRQACMKSLLTDLEALEYMLENEQFETGVTRIGAEQEMCFVDESWRPAPVIMDVLGELTDEHFVTEYLRFNMELNMDPVLFKGTCLSDMERDLKAYLDQGDEIAQHFRAHILLVGILPTIRRSDIGWHSMTPLPRYKALTDVLTEMRGGPFEFRIEGVDHLITKDPTAHFEGSNTSFQLHYQVDPDDFAKSYNWAQAVTGPLLAGATNSPFFLGKRLWRETRIALFQQSVDTRNASELFRERSPRVSFGTGWAKNSILDIYRDQVARHKLWLSSGKSEDPMKLVKAGKAPKLYALSVFNGTVYKWNRACYGITDGKPHLRIESRVLPAGPTVVDEMANAAFWLGMMHGRPEQYDSIHEQLDFDEAKNNFLRAARQGLGAHFKWPGIQKQIPSSELIQKELLPIAREGLKKANIPSEDIDRYLGIIEERVRTGRTGSQWLLDAYQTLRNEHSKDEAQLAATAGLFYRQQMGMPVHTWNLPEVTEAGHWRNRYNFVDQIMSTDLFTVNEEDPVEFVANIMCWRNIRHIPVESVSGELVGVVTAKHIMKHFVKGSENGDTEVSELMDRNWIAVSPETKTTEALDLMLANKLSCLPVLQEGSLVGLVTEHDFVKMGAQLLKEV